MPRISRVCILSLLSVAAAFTTGFLFLSATATATGRFWYCGPSALEHADPACRIGMKLLLASYGAGAVAILLGAVALWLYIRRRKAAVR